jgi:hypothetical protein
MKMQMPEEEEYNEKWWIEYNHNNDGMLKEK